MDKEIIGERIKKALAAKGMNQSEAASKLGVAKGRISEYVTGRVTPPYWTMERMIDVLDLDPRILFPEWTAKAAVKEYAELAPELSFA